MTSPAAARLGRFRERTGEAPSMRYVRRFSAVVVIVFAIIGVISGYRAIVQVYSVELHLPSDTLRPGSTVRVGMTSSARTFTHMRLVLAQGAIAETLAVKRVPGNEVRFAGASLNPWPMRDSMTVEISGASLGRFSAGPAVLRGVGTGTSQWMRVPPPKVVERAVTLVPQVP